MSAVNQFALSNRLVSSLVRAAVFTACLWGVLPTVASMWSFGLQHCGSLFDIPLRFEPYESEVFGRRIVVSAPITQQIPPSTLLNVVVVVAASGICCACFAARRVQDAYRPLRIGLCVVAAVQIIACCCAAIMPIDYDGRRYMATGLIDALRLLVVMPCVMSVVSICRDVRPFQQVGLLVLISMFLCVFPPLQYLTHVIAVRSGSNLFFPLLRVVFGPFLQIMAILALYGYGMSWESSAQS